MALIDFIDGLSGGFNSFTMDLIFWGLVVLVIAGAGYWWMITYITYKYLFVEVGRNGNLTTKKGKIAKNKNGIKKFCVKGYEDVSNWLPIKEANGLFQGKSARFIAWDGQGNLTYTSGFEIDKSQYIKTALTPIERSEAVDGQMESIEKGNILSTIQKWTLGVSIVLIAFSCITIMMTAKWQFENQDSYTKTAQLNLEASENVAKQIEVIEGNTIAMNNLLGTLNRLLGQNSSIIIDTK